MLCTAISLIKSLDKMNDISLGISPCPNDTFMFHNLLNKSKLDTIGIIDAHGCTVSESAPVYQPNEILLTFNRGNLTC